MNDINDSVDFDDHRPADDEPIEDDPPVVSEGTLAQLRARK